MNQFALVYHWQGTDASLKPVLLTAHQGEHTPMCSLSSSFSRLSQMSCRWTHALRISGFSRPIQVTSMVSSPICMPKGSYLTMRRGGQANGYGVVEAVTTNQVSLPACGCSDSGRPFSRKLICAEYRIAVESLLQKRFSPARSVVLAYGIDEERGGVDVSFPLQSWFVWSQHPRIGCVAHPRSPFEDLWTTRIFLLGRRGG